MRLYRGEKVRRNLPWETIIPLRMNSKTLESSPWSYLTMKDLTKYHCVTCLRVKSRTTMLSFRDKSHVVESHWLNLLMIWRHNLMMEYKSDLPDSRSSHKTFMAGFHQWKTCRGSRGQENEEVDQVNESRQVIESAKSNQVKELFQTRERSPERKWSSRRALASWEKHSRKAVKNVRQGSEDGNTSMSGCKTHSIGGRTLSKLKSLAR